MRLNCKIDFIITLLSTQGSHQTILCLITLSYQSCPYIFVKPTRACPFFSNLFLYLSSNRNNVKVYIGYLPISVQEEELRTVFQPYCEVANVIIKKGNAQGTFDKFCYGFVTIMCDQKRALQIIAAVERTCPNWRMKIKDEAMQPRERPQMRQNNMNPYPTNNYPHQMNPYEMRPPPPPMVHMHNQQHHQMRPNYNYMQNQNDRGEIKGQKTNKIIVRELWLGGIPQLTDHNYMKEVMSRFGQVEATQIFPKFAFVKFKKAADAAAAYERAHIIYQTFGENSGFRISFSDPSRRKDIVANHYQFERNSNMLPILFLGFPPITSANIDLGHMLSICDKFGPIVNHYMKKSTNSQMRSYFLFTYDSLKTAMKAKIQLSRRKDLLGEKRVEITLLLEENSILQGHDFSYTEKHYVSEQGGDRAKRPPFRNFQPQNQGQGQGGYGNGYQQHQQGQGMMGNYHQMNQSSSNYQQHQGHHQQQYQQHPQHQQQNQHQSHQYYDQQNSRYPPPPQQAPYYYPPSTIKPPEVEKKQEEEQKPNQDVLNLLHSVLDEPSDKKPPQKDQQEDNQNASDIISKILGVVDNHDEEGEVSKNEDQNKDREPNWAGFLTWRGGRRAGVDGYIVAGECELTDYNINITSVMSLSDVVLKDKAHMMILEPTNSISEPVFGDYLKALGKKAGVTVTKNWLIYLIGKCFLSEKIHKIKDNQLLMIMEKSSLVNQIKDKTVPCDDTYFE